MEKKAAKKYLENKTAIIAREAIKRNRLIKSSKLAALCDFEYNLSWCEGYFIALYRGIENSGADVCAPRHRKSKQVVFESAWVIVKNFLSRSPDDSKMRFYDSAVLALTERENCDAFTRSNNLTR